MSIRSHCKGPRGVRRVPARMRERYLRVTPRDAREERAMSDAPQPTGPDLAAGIAEDTLADGEMLVGRVEKNSVLIARRGTELFAIDSTCTHYGGPLGEGLLVGDTVRCPWHHACFSLRTGEALAAPAINPVHCWRIERSNGRLRVREQLKEAPPVRGAQAQPRESAERRGG